MPLFCEGFLSNDELMRLIDYAKCAFHKMFVRILSVSLVCFEILMIACLITGNKSFNGYWYRPICLIRLGLMNRGENIPLIDTLQFIHQNCLICRTHIKWMYSIKQSGLISLYFFFGCNYCYWQSLLFFKEGWCYQQFLKEWVTLL